jgi:hypothetical protein
LRWGNGVVIVKQRQKGKGKKRKGNEGNSIEKSKKRNGTKERGHKVGKKLKRL